MKKQFNKTKLGKYLAKHVKVKNIIKNSLIMLLIVALVIPLHYALGIMKVKEENIFLILTVAVIIVLIQTKNIVYGIISSFLFVLSFNLLNAEPLFTLDINDPNYYISFIIFIVVCLIVGSLVVDLQKRNKIANESVKKINAMYDLSSRLLDNHDKPYIFDFVVKFFKENLSEYKFGVYDINGSVYGEIKENEDLHKMMEFALDKNIVVGNNTFSFKESPYLVFPIRSKETKHGALFVYLNDEEMPQDEIEFINQNIFHLVVALDREFAIKEQQNVKVSMEKEKLKNALLRSLSHDLKTPLTSIKSGSDLMLSSYDKIDDDTKKEIIHDIYNDACDLNEFILNLLNMTKLNQDKNIVKRKYEAVDDILNEVKVRYKKTLNGKTLEIENNKELVFVYADAILLEQVISNLISNAIKHTKEGTHIIVRYYKEENGVGFEVEDDGGGIKEENIEKIFEDFYTLALKQDHQRGTGLGLSICKAIVEAHGGHISVYNNDKGGATFKFNILNQIKEN